MIWNRNQFKQQVLQRLESIENKVTFIQQYLFNVNHQLNNIPAIVDKLNAIAKVLGIGVAKNIVIQFKIGDKTVPASITDSQSISATIAETDAAGQPVTVDPTKVTWSVGDSTVAELTQNADGSASFKALKVGTTQVAVSDSGSGLSAQDVLTVTAGAATSLVITFGTPQ